MSLWQKLISSCRSPAYRPNPILDAALSCSSLQMRDRCLSVSFVLYLLPAI